MQNTLHQRIYRSADDTPSGAETPTPPTTETPTEPTPEPPTQEPPAQQQQPTPLTPEDIEERSYRAAQRAIADMRRADDEARRTLEARVADQQRFQQRQINPTADALDALDLRNDLYEEALSLHPDMPQEARQQLKEDLRSFKTVESLRAARDSSLHKKLSDAAAGEAIRAGRYIPKNVTTQALSLTREPAASEPPASKVPEIYRRQQQEVAAFLGISLTEQEMLEGYLLDSSLRA